MGTKYTSQTQSGYNQFPPPDDGSTGTNNLIQWNGTHGIKTTIGDPILVLAQNINTALLNALDFGSRTTATSDTASAADHMKTIQITASGATTMTLPIASVVGAGFIVSYYNSGSGTASVVLQTNTDSLNSAVNGTDTISPGQSKTYKTNTAANGYFTVNMYNGASQALTSRRQTALIGPKDVTGVPSFLPSSATGLNITTQNIASIETTQTANVTTPVASPGVVTWTGHTLAGNQAVSFTTNGALPTGLTAGTAYYVVGSSITTNTFEVSAAPGGSAINFTGSTSGQSVCWAGTQYPLVVTSYQGNDTLAGEINVNGLTTSNLTWSSLTNGSTNYLYVTISNGVLTPAFTTSAPVVVDGSITQPSATSGQITIDKISGESYLGNGTSAVETPLVVLGTATASGGNITTTQTYNYGKPPTSTSAMSGTLLKRTVYTTAGTFVWVKSALTSGVNVKVKGGGGAGGLSVGETLAINSAGAGGGEGGYAEGLFDASTFNYQTVTLALGGSSSFGSLISATNGGAGAAGQSSSGAIGGADGGSGGTGTGGDIQLGGQAGGSTTSINTANGYTLCGGTGGGIGGGKGGHGTSGTAGIAGGNGTNGAGGGGASPGTSSGASGGTASVGYVIVEEYA